MKLLTTMLRPRSLRVGMASFAALGMLVAVPASAQAAQAPVPLASAGNYAVLAGAGVTNTGKTTLNGDVGSSPDPSIKDLGTLKVNGSRPVLKDVAIAQLDLGTAFKAASIPTSTKTVGTELASKTPLKPGVYDGGALGITGTLTLDGTGNPEGVFIFRATSTLITGAGSHVKLVNVNPCNVFWQIKTSATLGTNSEFVGTIMAAKAASLNTGATVNGRVLAQEAGVTLESNTITKPLCQVTSATTATPSATPSAQVTQVPTGAVRTGDGSTSGNNTQGLLTGALLLAGVGGASVVATRRRRINN